MTLRKMMFALLVLCSLNVAAQQTAVSADRAEQVFGYLLADQADSLFAAMNAEMQEALPKDQLKGGLAEIERVLGAYQGHEAWQQQEKEGFQLFTSVVAFGQGRMQAVLAFDADGLMTGMHLVPVQEVSDDEPLPADAVAIDDVVHTGDSIALPCTVVLSGQSDNPPIVVMVHGSGPLDRDETVMGNKTFRDLATQLAAHGISSLRYDKRTYVSQQPAASMDDETVDDALSAIALARTYNNKVVLLGHSLGAMMAPAIALRAEDQLAGVVMMAAPARNLEQVVGEQIDYLSPENATPEEKRQAVEQLRQQMPHYFMPYGQVEAALELQLPLLLLQGERDYQVTMTDYRLWQQALQNRPATETHSFPALNHLFIAGEGPSVPQEYVVKKPIPSEVVAIIADFIGRLK